MKTLADQLCQYAAYHRDRRNIATHLVGIPLIVLAVAVLLGRPQWAVGGLTVSPALAAAAATALYHLRLDLRLGAVMALLLALCVAAAHAVAGWSTAAWLGTGLGLFIVGWVIQFVGHAFEGRKPAFVDDVVGLVIGPLFVVAEVAFLLGLRPALAAEIERRAGPLRSRRAPQQHLA
jgi:uncharacterized membrane protein YGL010W